MKVRTRFAPSPTGYLHIGGVRTALFNWLFARQHGGQFLLRIDDTDQQRNVDAALKPILDGFRWLGIDWDEGPEVGGPYAPYYQSQRADRYQAAVQKLLESGHAYHDYATTEELQAEREAVQAAGGSFVYSRKWMAETPEDKAKFESEGRAGVVRLKTPREGKLVVPDLIRGNVEFDWSREQDHVVQRADGSCLYHLATVVDEHDFDITHVIRAEEHLSNTPRQWFIADALGYEQPQYAHLPYVAEPGSKNKLSKRKLDKYMKNADFKKVCEHGDAIAKRLGLETAAETFNPVIVDFYEQVGYLSDAVINYLVLLGWSLDDKTEDFSREEMLKHFSLERVTKAPASFDPQKLDSVQERYMQRLPVKQKAKMVLPYLQQAGLIDSPPPCDTGPKLAQIVTAAGDRIKVAGDILDFDDFFLPDDALEYNEKSFQMRFVKIPAAVEFLGEFADRLASIEPFEPAKIEEGLKAFLEEKEMQIGEVIHGLRVAVTGKPVGFGMFETMAILGPESCQKRIKRAVESVPK